MVKTNDMIFEKTISKILLKFGYEKQTVKVRDNNLAIVAKMRLPESNEIDIHEVEDMKSVVLNKAEEFIQFYQNDFIGEEGKFTVLTAYLNVWDDRETKHKNPTQIPIFLN